MIGLNPLRTRVLITTDEVVFHAPIEGTVDVRFILQSIIIAERRFIKPMLGTNLYNELTAAKNTVVTEDNKTALEAALNAGRPEDRAPLTLVVGDMVNSATYLTADQQMLWNDHLWKIVAECVYFCSLPTNRARFGAQGVTVNNPPSAMNTAAEASVELKDLKHLMDSALQSRIAPLLEDMHVWLCSVKATKFPGYDKDCSCNSNGVPYQKRTGIILSMYDSNYEECRCKWNDL